MIGLLLAAILTFGQVQPASVPQCFYVVDAGGNYLPDAHCTPGAKVDWITQDNVQDTLCVPGWISANLPRPPVRVTNALKRQGLIDYGRPSDDPRMYEEDHLVARELGGSSDPANLWPEPSPSPNRKDAVENAARRAVCDGSLLLEDAQRWIAGDWPGLADWLGVP